MFEDHKRQMGKKTPEELHTEKLYEITHRLSGHMSHLKQWATIRDVMPLNSTEHLRITIYVNSWAKKCEETLLELEAFENKNSNEKQISDEQKNSDK